MKRREGGAATIEFVWLTILLLVPFVYVLIGVFDTQRASYGVSTAARAAARAFLQAPDVVTAQQRARAAARVALDDQGLAGVSVRVKCLPTQADCLRPGSSVRVIVRTTTRLPLTPRVLGDQVGGVRISSTHTEPFGSFRSER